MAVAYVSSDIDNTTSKTLAGTGSDRLVFMADSGTSGGVRTLSTLTLNAVSGVTLETVSVDGGTAIMAGLAHIIDASGPGAGTFTIADTWGGGAAPGNDVYATIELSGVDQTTPRETVISNTTTALADGGTIGVTVTGYSGEFALCFICTTNGGASGGHTLPTGFTSIAEVQTGSNRTEWGYITSIGSASESYTFTASGDGSATMDSVVCGVVVINAASGATYTLAADAGIYSLTGTAASTLFNRVLAADSGAYSLTGTDAVLTFNRVITADAGSYTYTGTDATLTYTTTGSTYTIIADAGSYSLTGVDASLQFSRLLACDAGSYSLTGTDAALSRGRTLACDPGSYSVSGIDATFVYNRAISCDVGSYTLTGLDATLTYSGGGVWTIQGDVYTTWASQSDQSTTWSVQSNQSTTWTVQ